MQKSEIKNVCDYCNQPINHNREFYNIAFDITGKKWQELDKKEQGELIGDLRRKGIWRKLNLDGKPHICGQDKGYLMDMEKLLTTKLELIDRKYEMNLEVLKKQYANMDQQVKNLNQRCFKLEQQFNQFESSLSSKIQFELNLRKKE